MISLKQGQTNQSCLLIGKGKSISQGVVNLERRRVVNLLRREVIKMNGGGWSIYSGVKWFFRAFFPVPRFSSSYSGMIPVLKNANNIMMQKERFCGYILGYI